MLKNFDIITIASSDWHSPCWVNVQHIMSRLSEHNRILYIESLGLRAPSTSKSDFSKIVKRLRNWFKGIRKERENLWLYAPIIFPLHHLAIFRIINSLILTLSIKFIKWRLGFKKPILWIFLPTGVSLVGKLDEKFVIYHCVDEYSANPGVHSKTIENLEKKLLEKSDIVFTTSKSLFENKKKYNKNTYYLPNVADFEHFSKAMLESTLIPEDIKNITHPIAGFIGNITSYKVDFNLIIYLAENLPNVSIVLIGPIGGGDPSTDISNFKKYSNIYLMGERSYESLPGYLKAFDTTLIPFVINETTNSVFPMKFYEYMATGKPIVTTNLSSLRDFKEYCYIANNYDEFKEYILQSLKDSFSQKRIEFAKENSWDKRIEELSQLIENSQVFENS